MDSGLEVVDGAEGAAFERPFGEIVKEGLDGVEPGAGVGREVEGPARVLGERGEDGEILVGGVVVEDDVERLGGRDACVMDDKETDETLTPVAPRALAITMPSRISTAANSAVVLRHL